MAVEQAFTWGGGGRKRTQDQIDMERKIAAALVAKGSDFSPVGHWSQGLARVAQGVMGAVDDRRADAAENENAAYNSEIISALLGGSPVPAAQTSADLPATTGVGDELAATSPSAQPLDLSGNEVFSQFIDTVKQGGVQNPYALAAIAATGKAESGFDPKNATRTWSDPSESGQAGTAGGIMSWRGPRYQALAATGDLSPAGQAKFFLQENPQLIQSLNNAKSVEEAQTMMNNAWKFAGYDRPGGEASRRLRLASSFLPTFQGGEVASASPQAAMAVLPARGGSPALAAIESAAPASGYVDPMVSTPNYDPAAVSAPVPSAPAAASFDDRFNAPPAPLAFAAPEVFSPASGAPPLPAPREIGPAPAVAVAPQQQVAQALTAQPSQANPALNPAIIKALTDPRASPGTRAVAQIIMQQEQAKARAVQEQQSWLARQQYEQQQQRNDPLYQLKVQQAQNEATGQGKAPAVVEIFDEATGQPYKATWNPKSGQYERIGGVKARSGMQLTTNPDGTVSLTEGSIGNMPKLTESEGRNSGFYGRGVESHQILNNLESQGTSIWNKTVGSVPFVGNFAKSEDAQKYEQARRNFINSVLRRESGAVISPEEFSNADQQYFPQPGDGPEVIEQKRRNRETTIQGLKISSGQGAAFATPPAAAPPEKKRLKYNPQTGELE